MIFFSAEIYSACSSSQALSKKIDKERNVTKLKYVIDRKRVQMNLLVGMGTSTDVITRNR